MKFTTLILFSSLLAHSIISELVGVVELVRHGARSTFTFTERAAKLLIDTEKAQLTINGFRQHQILGHILRKNYVEKNNLISKEFNSKEVEIYSTPTERTVFSAAGQLSGLFPHNLIKINPADSPQMKNDDRPPFEDDYQDLDKKEITLNINSDHRDVIFRALKCRLPNSTSPIKSEFDRKSIFSLSKIDSKPFIDEIKTKIPELFKVKEKTDCKGESKPKKDIYSEEFFSDLIKFIIPVNYHYNNKRFLFSEATEEFLRKKVMSKWYTPRLNTNHAVRLSSSGFLDEFTNFFSKLIKKEGDTPKMKLFFGHDTNIVNLISNLFKPEFLREKIKSGVKNLEDFNFVVPQFAASFIFELHFNKEKNLYYVKILYNGKEIKEHLSELEYDKTLGGITFENFKTGMTSKIDMRYKDLNCTSESPRRKKLREPADRKVDKQVDLKKIEKEEQEEEDDEKEVKEYLEINILKKRKVKKFMNSIKLSA